MWCDELDSKDRVVLGMIADAIDLKDITRYPDLYSFLYDVYGCLSEVRFLCKQLNDELGIK